MTTLHEMANAVRETEAKGARDLGASMRFVHSVNYTPATPMLGDKPVKGYLLRSFLGNAVALIETLEEDKRVQDEIESRLAVARTRGKAMTARETVRGLLRAADCYSTMYDNIVRVHYAEDFKVEAL